MLLALIVGAQLAYLFAAHGQWRRGRHWSLWRLAAFLGGAGLVAAALSPPVVFHGHVDLRWHMAQHLLLGMFAPLLLVLAAPGTLLLRSVPRWVTRGLSRLLRHGLVRGLSHPLTALLLNVGGMYLLYLTPLYAASLVSPRLHVLIHLHFLLAGCLFTWAILAGPDPAPHAPGPRTRLGVLFCSMAAHATLGKLMYGFGWPRDTHHGPEEIQAAAQLMYYGGDLAELLLLVALFIRWPQPFGLASGKRHWPLRVSSRGR